MVFRTDFWNSPPTKNPSSKTQFVTRRDLESSENTTRSMGRVLLARRPGPVLRMQERKKETKSNKANLFSPNPRLILDCRWILFYLSNGRQSRIARS